VINYLNSRLCGGEFGFQRATGDTMSAAVTQFGRTRATR
jgi:hypothetical protein